MSRKFVYVVSYGTKFEGGDVEGVFAKHEDAKAFMHEFREQHSVGRTEYLEVKRHEVK